MTLEEKQELDNLRSFKEMILEGCHFVLLGMNDTFAWACADCEQVDVYDLPHLVPLFKQYGYDALNAYVAIKRGQDVLDHPKLRTQEYWAAKEKIKVLKDNIEYFMDP